MVDRYTKAVLTVIAAALVGLVVQNAAQPASAARDEPQAVFVAQISEGAAKCIGAYSSVTKGNTGPCIVGW